MATVCLRIIFLRLSTMERFHSLNMNQFFCVTTLPLMPTYPRAGRARRCYYVRKIDYWTTLNNVDVCAVHCNRSDGVDRLIWKNVRKLPRTRSRMPEEVVDILFQLRFSVFQIDEEEIFSLPYFLLFSAWWVHDSLNLYIRELLTRCSTSRVNEASKRRTARIR